MPHKRPHQRNYIVLKEGAQKGQCWNAAGMLYNTRTGDVCQICAKMVPRSSFFSRSAVYFIIITLRVTPNVHVTRSNTKLHHM